MDPFKKLALVTVLVAGLLVAFAGCGGNQRTPTPTPTQPAPTPTATGSTTGAAPTATKAATTPTPTTRDMAAYFKGKTINIVVGFSPGGGYDVVSRIFAAVASKYFPGNPRFIVSNLPGSGGLRALQDVMKAKPDGLTVTPMASRFIVPEVIGQTVPGFDLYNAVLIGSPTYTNVFQTYCVRRDEATSWNQMKASGKVFTEGTSSPGGDAIGPEFLQYLGEPMKVVYGYGGTSEVLAAVNRGELDGTTRCNFNYIQPLYPNMITDHTLVPVFWWRSPISQDWLNALGASAPPNLFDIVQASPEQQAAFTFADTAEAMTRMFTMAPGVPADVVATWRQAFKKTIADPDFINRAKAAQLDIGYGDPQQLLDELNKSKNFTDQGKMLLKSLYGL